MRSAREISTISTGCLEDELGRTRRSAHTGYILNVYPCVCDLLRAWRQRHPKWERRNPATSSLNGIPPTKGCCTASADLADMLTCHDSALPHSGRFLHARAMARVARAVGGRSDDEAIALTSHRIGETTLSCRLRFLTPKSERRFEPRCLRRRKSETLQQPKSSITRLMFAPGRHRLVTLYRSHALLMPGGWETHHCVKTPD